ncbi:MAG: hypothetical protein AAF340_18300 [Pseudomonadota bacterium]
MVELFVLLGLGLLLGGASGGSDGGDSSAEPEDDAPRDSFDAGTQAVVTDEISQIVTDLFDELETSGELSNAQRQDAEGALTFLNGPMDVATGADPDLIFGSSGDDSIDAGKGADIVFGNTGDDTIELGDGLDTYGVENFDPVAPNQPGALRAPLDEASIEGGDDWVRGGKGADVIADGYGSDRLAGNEGGDLIISVDQDEGNPDVVLGGFGFDTMIVDEGDTVTTGEGQDEVVAYLKGAVDAGYDPITITDFNRSDDMIQIQAPAAVLGNNPLDVITITELANGSGSVVEINGIPAIVVTGGTGLAPQDLLITPY